jgi:RHS repeat-associated protein
LINKQVFVANSDVFFDNVTMQITEDMIVQENHYYPFGLNMVGIEKQGMPDDRFQFGGKEKQSDFGLHWYDYQARQYDPQLGRWHAVDPVADMMRRFSPYNYCFDNPIRFIDPDGMKPDDLILTEKDGEGNESVEKALSLINEGLGAKKDKNLL